MIRELAIARTHLFRAAENASTAGQEELTNSITQMIVEINTLISKAQAEPMKNSPVILQDNHGRTLVVTDEA